LGPALQARETLSPIHARKRKALLAPSPAAANDAFQKAETSGRYIRTKIVTLKDRLDVGQPVHRRTWPKANEREVTCGARLCSAHFLHLQIELYREYKQTLAVQVLR